MTGPLMIIVIFMPIICGEHQELELIDELNKYFKFDYNIIFLDESVDASRFISSMGRRKQLTPTSVLKFKNVGGNITGMYNFHKLVYSKNTFLIVTSSSSDFERNVALLNLILAMQRMQLRMKIGLLFQSVASSQDLQKLFEWSWKNRIINIFATSYFNSFNSSLERLNSSVPQPEPCEITNLSATQNRLTCRLGSLNIFTYNPFGTLKVINVTGLTYDNFFLRQNCNFHQHPLRVIRYRSDYFWPIVFRAMNASYMELQFNDTTRADVINNQMDVVLGVTISISSPYNMAIVKYNKDVIVVPEALPYEKFAAYLEAMTKGKFFVYSSILIVSVMVILSIVRYIKRKKILFFESAGDVLNLLMNDNGYNKYQLLNHSEFWLIVPLTFVGLVIVNGILSQLQSYLTQPQLQPQVHTVEDIYRSSLSILVQSEYSRNFTAYTLSILSKHKAEDWMEKMQIVMDLQSRYELFNNSLAVSVPKDVADKLIRIQKKVGIKCYHISERHIHNTFSTYIVHNAFPFIDRLNDIIRRLHSAGLYDEWKRRQDRLDDQKLIEKRFGSKMNFTTNPKVESLPIPTFIFYGWIAGAILLVIEIIWKKLSKNMCRSKVAENFG